MTVGMILEFDFVGADTEVIIMKGIEVVAKGNWYIDAVQDHVTEEAKQFKWLEDDKVIIDLKEA